MGRKAKVVDIYQYGEMAPYIEDESLFAREMFPDLKVALDHAIYLNSLLPETWNMRTTRANFADMKKELEGGTPPENLNHWTKASVYDIIRRYDAQTTEKLDAKFHAWYANNPQFEPAYQSCKDNRWIGYVHEGKQYSYDEAVQLGYNMKPPNFHMFRTVMNQSDARSYMELNRALPFEEGDIVFLRKPYVGSWNYDPFPEMARDEVRIGTVLALTDNTKGWRAAKGSRYISVLWMGTPNQKKQVPVRCLKLNVSKSKS